MIANGSGDNNRVVATAHRICIFLDTGQETITCLKQSRSHASDHSFEILRGIVVSHYFFHATFEE